MNDWNNASHTNSPDSIRQAILLGLGAVLTMGAIAWLFYSGVVTIKMNKPSAVRRR